MLSRQDNELLCRVGPGTATGELMRQYWMPVLYDWELEPDGAPLRVRVLGEDLIAWRDTNVRRRLLEAVKALRDRGTLPPGVADASVYRVRSCLTMLPADADWLEALADWHNARTLEHPNPGFMGRRRILEQAVGAEYATDQRAQ